MRGEDEEMSLTKHTLHEVNDLHHRFQPHRLSHAASPGDHLEPENKKEINEVKKDRRKDKDEKRKETGTRSTGG